MRKSGRIGQRNEWFTAERAESTAWPLAATKNQFHHEGHEGFVNGSSPFVAFVLFVVKLLQPRIAIAVTLQRKAVNVL